MTEDERRARLAICQCLEAYGGYLSQPTIDSKIFFGMADDHALKATLTLMVSEGLLQRVSNGCYRLDDGGREFLAKEG